MQSTMHFLQEAATFINKLAVAVKKGDEAELLCRMVSESNVREEYMYYRKMRMYVLWLFNLLRQCGTVLKQNQW